MPIYCYLCLEHGEHEIFARSFNKPNTHKCPECDVESQWVIGLPARIDIKRDWNEKANDYQRNPYTQAKAQLINVDREEQERLGKKPMKITEKTIQSAAKQIADSKKLRKTSIVTKQQRIQQRNLRKTKLIR